jgi:hypothetical protein
METGQELSEEQTSVKLNSAALKMATLYSAIGFHSMFLKVVCS